MLERLSILIPMNRLSVEQRVRVLSALVDGVSIRATCRMTGVAKNTVVHLLEDVGAACLAYQQEALVNLPCKRIQCDEIWSFIGMKQAQVKATKRNKGEVGDIWTWTAIDADTKLVPTFFVGDRSGVSARMFLSDLEKRLANRVQLTTDGFRSYLIAVEDVFGWGGVDYAMLDKIYGADFYNDRRYSPAVCIGTEVRQVMGNPDTKHISTSYVERSNLTMRMGMRRFTRLTNAFSKKVENHEHAVALHFMHYNFCRPHQTLTKANKGVLKTPAMAAGVTDHVWKLEEVVALLED
jgi:IS1 family transposase